MGRGHRSEASYIAEDKYVAYEGKAAGPPCGGLGASQVQWANSYTSYPSLCTWMKPEGSAT